MGLVSAARVGWVTAAACLPVLTIAAIQRAPANRSRLASVTRTITVKHFLYCALMGYCILLDACWLGGRKGIRPVKKWGNGGGGHWLVRMEWRSAGWSVYLPLLIFPCTIKSRSSLLAPAHPGGPGKRAVKRLWWWWWIDGCLPAEPVPSCSFEGLARPGIT